MQIFLVVAPGLEPAVAAEARELGLEGVAEVPGGVLFEGGWSEVWRANLWLRGATRVLARVAEFRAMHLAQLDKRSRKLDWSFLRPDVPVRIEATCRKSRIYHAGAATERVARALREGPGITVAEDADLRLMVRIEDDLCTISVDTSGAPLHQRGHKEAVGKAPLRETLAANFLRICDYTAREPVLDPMCGSGTIPIEAAEIALGLPPGRSRAFGFQALKGFDQRAFEKLYKMGKRPENSVQNVQFIGFDRDAGAIARAKANADRARVSDHTHFECQAISDLTPPAGPPGLILVNPPYGGRIGNKKLLYGLYGTLGEIVSTRFPGWRLGLVTSEPSLARATGLRFHDPGPVIPHGGLKVQLWRTGPFGSN